MNIKNPNLNNINNISNDKIKEYEEQINKLIEENIQYKTNIEKIEKTQIVEYQKLLDDSFAKIAQLSQELNDSKDKNKYLEKALNIVEKTTRIEIETNKRHQKASNSHSSIVINNLTNYSFGFSEHKLNSEENDINNESKNDIIGSFQRNKNNITQKRKCDSVVKIKLTKMKKSKIVNTPRIETLNFKKVNKEVNLSDKEIENLIESSGWVQERGNDQRKYRFKYILEDGEDYSVIYSIRTINGYEA